MDLKILLVDDDPQRLRGLQSSLEGAAHVIIRHPLDVSEDDLRNSDLVSVDEYLGEDWSAALATRSMSEPASIKNVDGLAVAASFRSQTRQAESSDLDFAVSLHTGELAKLAEGLPQRSREALTAAQHDLDWVFAFEDANLGNRLVQLAFAVRSAARAVVSLQSDFGASWLELPQETTWASTAHEQIEDCRPPAHALASNTGGRSYVRWLAQRILPYPTFLLDPNHAANLLGITQESFEQLVRSPVTEKSRLKYEGPLDAFLGRRWWRAGWQQLLVDAGVNQWDSAAARASALTEFTMTKLEPLPFDQPVVAYNGQGSVVDIGADPERSVRLQADGWPIYADDPWGRLQDVADDPGLQRLVAQSDRARLSAA